MWSVVRDLLLLCLFHLSIADEGIVKTVAGGGTAHSGAKTDCVETDSAVDGVRYKARFNYPWGIVFDPDEDMLYVADCGCPESLHSNDKIRKVHVSTGTVTTLAGSAQGYKDGVGQEAHFHHPAGMVIDRKEGVLYVADTANERIRSIELKSAQVRTFVGSGQPGYVEGVGTQAQLQNPQALALDTKGKRLFISDTDNHAIRVVTLPEGTVSTLAGGSRGFHDGVEKEAKFHHPTGISFDQNTGILYVADHYNHVIRTVNTADGTVSTLAGGGREGFKDGKGKDARFHYPEGIHFDAEYKVLYVVDFDSNAVRMVTAEGDVSTVAGGTEGYSDGLGKNAKFFHPTGLTFDSKNKIIYVTDQYNHMVRSISARGSTQRVGGDSGPIDFMLRTLPGITGDNIESLVEISSAVPLYSRLLQTASGGSDTRLLFVFCCLSVLVLVLCCRPLWRKRFRNYGTRA